MSLTELESHIFAYWIANEAKDFTVAGRFYPHGDLILTMEDKLQIATRKFGARVRSKARAPGIQFLDTLIEKGAFSTTKNEYGGSMHQFQPGVYATTLKEMQDADPIVQQARGEGPDYWRETFERLTA
jgi:hypothetical protein